MGLPDRSHRLLWHDDFSYVHVYKSNCIEHNSLYHYCVFLYILNSLFTENPDSNDALPWNSVSGASLSPAKISEDMKVLIPARRYKQYLMLWANAHSFVMFTLKSSASDDDIRLKSSRSIILASPVEQVYNNSDKLMHNIAHVALYFRGLLSTTFSGSAMMNFQQCILSSVFLNEWLLQDLLMISIVYNVLLEQMWLMAYEDKHAR